MASKRHLRRKNCQNKRAYPDFQTANIAAKGSSRTFGGHMNAYRCSFCHLFHVGHTPRRIRQIMEAKIAEGR